MISK
ncbi:Protein of unknown function [Propionibacterium freudenreichii]|jgi:tetratricopeptide (TPR) repeat protein